MDTLITLMTVCLTSSALTSLITHLIDRRDKREDASDDRVERIEKLEKSYGELRDGLDFCKRANHLQLKDRVIFLTNDAVENGWISLDCNAFIADAVELLHEDGENGEMSACLRAIEPLPVRQTGGGR